MEDQKSALVLDDLVLINQLEEQMLNKLLEYSHLQKVLEAKKWKINIKINPNPKSDVINDDKKMKYEALTQNESFDQLAINKCEIKEEYFSDYEQEPQGNLVVNLKMLHREDRIINTVCIPSFMQIIAILSLLFKICTPRFELLQPSQLEMLNLK